MRSTDQNLDIRTEYTKTFYVDCKYNYDSQKKNNSGSQLSIIDNQNNLKQFTILNEISSKLSSRKAQISDFKILRKLGQGAYGKVYLSQFKD